MPAMKKQILAVFFAVITTTLSVLAQQRQTTTGKVVAVLDGDTLTVIDGAKQQYEVRIDGIDAPEMEQAFGDRAKKSLYDLVYGKTVTITGSKPDRRGRVIGKVTLRDKDIGLMQIERGLAWYFRKYANGLSREDAQKYELAEDGARTRQRGLWASPGPIPPWELRAAQRGQSAEWDLEAASGEIIGNRNDNIYHRPNCPDYLKVSESARVYFKTEQEAIAAGYKKARNCP
jgi:endonuclease YncB( thermonuclease family)